MNALARLGRKLAAFFVDDALLGGATVASVLVATLCRALVGGRPLVAGCVLAGGCLLALTLSVARAAAASPRNQANTDVRCGAAVLTGARPSLIGSLGAPLRRAPDPNSSQRKVSS